MRWLVISCLWATALAAANSSTAGIEALVARRLPQYAKNFSFQLTPSNSAGSNSTMGSGSYDSYTVMTNNGKIQVSSSTLAGLNRGLYAYLTEIAQTDIYWTGSYLDTNGAPALNQTLSGSSIVKWRYHFNTVTFSYTAAFWDWEQWELQLDWMALRGINLPLAWVGFEKTLIETFMGAGLTVDQIIPFLSGPAFQAWNRFGNIQGSWNTSIPMQIIDDQFTLGKKIVQRMVDLGMTPVMPAFTGFVPRAYAQLNSSANFVNSSTWSDFPLQYTNDTFLLPEDPNFQSLQLSFLQNQQKSFGNVSHIYTLDQFNENTPPSGNSTYLASVSRNTWKSLKAADPDAIWLMQGWLFFSLETFWTNDRIKAFLDGVPNNQDMLILDLFSEVQPQWQRTQSYYGKPWIWCLLHDYGGNMGFYGNLYNETAVPVNALNSNTTMTGMGLTMEGQEGNELVYDLLLDQAWQKTAVETQSYVQKWATRRYGGGSLPDAVIQAWEILRSSVYANNDTSVQATVKGVFELVPNNTGLMISGHHPTKLFYDPMTVVQAWRLLLNASSLMPELMERETFHHDLTDVTRQVLANAFIPAYQQLISAWNSTNATASAIKSAGSSMIDILTTLDQVLYTNPDFLLSEWIGDATGWSNSSNSSITAFLEYNARNQITLWGPEGEITDYASKQWAGLVGQYYVPRWQSFVDYLSTTGPTSYNFTTFKSQLQGGFEQTWNAMRWTGPWTTQGNLLSLCTTNPILTAM